MATLVTRRRQKVALWVHCVAQTLFCTVEFSMQGYNGKLLNVQKEAVLLQCMTPRKTSCCTTCLRDEFQHQYVSDVNLSTAWFVTFYSKLWNWIFIFILQGLPCTLLRTCKTSSDIRTILRFGKVWLKRILWPRQRWIVCALDCAWLHETNCLFLLKGRTFCETWNSRSSDDEESSLSIWKIILEMLADVSKCRVPSSSGWNSMSGTFLWLIDPENGDVMIILNVRKYLPRKYLPNDGA